MQLDSLKELDLSEGQIKVYSAVLEVGITTLHNIQEKTGAEKCVVPRYAVLNFCRVLAFINEGLIISKIEGGEWGLKKLPKEYHPIISAALQEQCKIGSSEKIDPNILKNFAFYSYNKIRETVNQITQ